MIIFICLFFVYLLVPSLSFCDEKATVALYLGLICIRLGVTVEKSTKQLILSDFIQNT